MPVISAEPPVAPVVEEPTDPCSPSPCGLNAQCSIKQDFNGYPTAGCVCNEGYKGIPPYCEPNCIVDSDCRPYLACRTPFCYDPCEGECAFNADCSVQGHRAVCTCPAGMIGDPYTTGCRERPPGKKRDCSVIVGMIVMIVFF